MSELQGRIVAATAKDVGRIYKFFASQNDPNVLPRPESDYEDAADSGTFFLAEVEENLVAAGGAFPLCDRKDSPFELGGMLVIPDFRGFGIQSAFLQIRIGSIIANINEKPTIYTAVKPTNEHSRSNVISSGYELARSPDPLLLDPCKDCNSRPAPDSGRVCCCDFYEISREKMKQSIFNFLRQPFLRSTRGSDQSTLTLDYDLMLARQPAYRIALEEFLDS